MTTRSILAQAAKAPVAGFCYVIGLTVFASLSVTESIQRFTGSDQDARPTG